MSARGPKQPLIHAGTTWPNDLTRDEAAWMELIRAASRDDVRSPSLIQVRVLRRMIRRAAVQERS
jgi:hypothetical protein